MNFFVLSRGNKCSGHSNRSLVLALWLCNGWKPWFWKRNELVQMLFSALPLGLVLPIN